MFQEFILLLGKISCGYETGVNCPARPTSSGYCLVFLEYNHLLRMRTPTDRQYFTEVVGRVAICQGRGMEP
ncbi:hypothetical protein J6590_083315 [Homalodisca vitripennis]|nr:hypothetical protein J6590_083315 [Homalodisca vitripennis]